MLKRPLYKKINALISQMNDDERSKSRGSSSIKWTFASLCEAYNTACSLADGPIEDRSIAWTYRVIEREREIVDRLRGVGYTI